MGPALYLRCAQLLSSCFKTLSIMVMHLWTLQISIFFIRSDVKLLRYELSNSARSNLLGLHYFILIGFIIHRACSKNAF